MNDLFPVIALLNLGAVGLTVYYHKVMTTARLNERGEARVADVPGDAMEMINSGGTAMLVLRILFTREYATFGSAALTQAGNWALAGQVIALTLMLGAFVLDVVRP